MTDEKTSKIFGFAIDVEDKLREDCEPHIIRPKNEMQILLEGVGDPITNALEWGIRHGGFDALRSERDGARMGRGGSLLASWKFWRAKVMRSRWIVDYASGITLGGLLVIY
jgi:hypothetical protein